MTKKTIYRISFTSQNNVYEVYAKIVNQGDIFGFIQIEEIVFGETSSVVLDPSEEHLKMEFQGVKKTYVPLHAVLRIDVVEKEGVGKITTTSKDGSNIAQFPTSLYTLSKKPID
jgi:hypothetical protein